MDQKTFDDLYWLHQPDPVRALRGLEYPNTQALAMTLASQGFIIDNAIMVYGWGPYLVMQDRIASGYTWVPNALQPPVQIAPGIGFDGTLTPYDPKNAPAGSIKVSIDPADYPPYDPPIPVAVVPVGKKHVGPINGIGVYVCLVPLSNDGDVIKEGGTSYTFHKVQNPFGFSEWYT